MHALWRCSQSAKASRFVELINSVRKLILFGKGGEDGSDVIGEFQVRIGPGTKCELRNAGLCHFAIKQISQNCIDPKILDAYKGRFHPCP